jgi:hypothetical protein
MKAENKTTGHNRFIRVTGLPPTRYNTPKSMTIRIEYDLNDDISPLVKAIALDHIVIPAIIKALNRK